MISSVLLILNVSSKFCNQKCNKHIKSTSSEDCCLPVLPLNEILISISRYGNGDGIYRAHFLFVYIFKCALPLNQWVRSDISMCSQARRLGGVRGFGRTPPPPPPGKVRSVAYLQII